MVRGTHAYPNEFHEMGCKEVGGGGHYVALSNLDHLKTGQVTTIPLCFMDVQISILWPHTLRAKWFVLFPLQMIFFDMPGAIWNNIQCSLVKNIGEVVYHNPSQAHVIVSTCYSVNGKDLYM